MTDGHPSYPSVAANLEMQHCVVNHTLSFTNEDGDHTNHIEGLWATLKSEIGKKGGFMFENVDKFLKEFTFKKKYIHGASDEELRKTYLNLLKKVFF